MVRKLVGIAVFTAVVCAANPSWTKDGPEQHAGFFLRLTYGLGLAGTDLKGNPDDTAFFGLSGLSLFSIGGAVTDNLILSLDTFGTSSNKPMVKLNGAKQDDNYDTSTRGIGPGFTYYFMPLNLYLSGSIGVAFSGITPPTGKDQNSEVGWAFNLAFGKEWWASDNWGLGLGLQLFYARMPMKAIDGHVSTLAGGLLLTATYN